MPFSSSSASGSERNAGTTDDSAVAQAEANGVAQAKASGVAQAAASGAANQRDFRKKRVIAKHNIDIAKELYNTKFKLFFNAKLLSKDFDCP